MTPIDAYRNQIEAALVYSHHSHTFDDVRAMCENDLAQCWIGPQSVIITEIITYPQHRVLNFFLAGGDLMELEAMTPGVLDFGRDMGCSYAHFAGRKGWERTFLTKTGWASKLVVLEKSLDGKE